MNHLIVSLVATNPNIILATINPDFLAFAVSKFFMSIPKNLISAMSAFVVSLFSGFDGDFLWHKLILSFFKQPLPQRLKLYHVAVFFHFSFFVPCKHG